MSLMPDRSNPLATARIWDLVAAHYLRDIAPRFALFADEALRLADVGAGARVLDVACGPGLLAVEAARRGAHAFAVDISPEMIACAREAARAAGVEVDAHVGDGTALPFGQESFDAAACLFAIMFFPDRAKGFRELYRVLRCGGLAVVARQLDRAPLLADIYRTLRAVLPQLPFGPANQPVCDSDECGAEMRTAGFRDVDVHEVTRTFEISSAEEFWLAIKQTTPAIRFAQESLSERWPEIDGRMTNLLRARWGTGSQRVVMTANLVLGRR